MDRPKRQTSTVTPAKPGDYLFYLLLCLYSGVLGRPYILEDEGTSNREHRSSLFDMQESSIRVFSVWRSRNFNANWVYCDQIMFRSGCNFGIFLVTKQEEKRLVHEHGDEYLKYK